MHAPGPWTVDFGGQPNLINRWTITNGHYKVAEIRDKDFFGAQAIERAYMAIDKAEGRFQ